MSRAAARKRQSKPKKTARKRPRGRPSKFTPGVAKRILDGLANGTPLTIICESINMPDSSTVWEWARKDEGFSQAIARARDAGFDRIAMDALEIADQVTDKDTIETKFGALPNKEWILRSRLRVETRLKLLAKWDPKRYGEKITQEISGPDGGPVRTEGDFRPSPEDEAVIRRIAETRAKLEDNAEA